VLDDAMLAFWRHGYLGTGVQELVTATGINRASLYSTFGNKQQLFLTALKRYTGICVAELRSALGTGENRVAGIRNMLDHFMAGILKTSRGCMLYNTALEVSTYDKQICETVEAGMREIESLLVEQIEAAQAEGELSAGLEPLMLSRTVMAAMQSMTVRSNANAAPDVLESIRDGAMLIFGRI
jgi:TetR/AcrR family transcriptional repressor of nem operon